MKYIILIIYLIYKYTIDIHTMYYFLPLVALPRN